jgi:hypothetical protein
MKPTRPAVETISMRPVTLKYHITNQKIAESSTPITRNVSTTARKSLPFM